VAISTGSAWTDWCAGGFPASASCNCTPVSALPPFIQGTSRMREIRSYGSVRGVAGDRYPYRDPSKTRMSPRSPTASPFSSPRAGRPFLFVRFLKPPPSGLSA